MPVPDPKHDSPSSSRTSSPTSKFLFRTAAHGITGKSVSTALQHSIKSFKLAGRSHRSPPQKRDSNVVNETPPLFRVSPTPKPPFSESRYSTATRVPVEGDLDLLPEFNFSVSPLTLTPLSSRSSVAVKTQEGYVETPVRRRPPKDVERIERSRARSTSLCEASFNLDFGAITGGRMPALGLATTKSNSIDVHGKLISPESVKLSPFPNFATPTRTARVVYPRRRTSPVRVGQTPETIQIAAPPLPLKSPYTPGVATPQSTFRESLGGAPPVLRLQHPTPPSQKPEDSSGGFATIMTPSQNCLLRLNEQGIWKNIAAHLSLRDRSKLSQTSKAIKTLVEPILYNHIHLAPQLPHHYSFAALSEIIEDLLNPGNWEKLKQHTRIFTVAKGWEENSTVLLDMSLHARRPDRRFTPGEEIRDKDGTVLVAVEDLEKRLKKEGVEGDGGYMELNTVLIDVLRKMAGLERFEWDAPIPLRAGMLDVISRVKTLTQVSMYLAQPNRMERNRDNIKDIRKSVMPKYRPNIRSLAPLNLTDLTLRSLPTRGGPWWNQVWVLLAACSGTLKVLRIEMPKITKERYPALFTESDATVSSNPIELNLTEDEEEENERSDIATIDENLGDRKRPPTLDYEAFMAIKKKGKFANQFHSLHTLILRGLMVDEKFINQLLKPGVLKKFSLIGCYPSPGFYLEEKLAAGTESFRTDNPDFIGTARKVLTASLSANVRCLKEVCILGSERDFGMHSLPLEGERFLDIFVMVGGNIRVLALSEHWELDAKYLRKILTEAGGSLEELALSVDFDHWDYFLSLLPLLQKLRKIHILNGFSLPLRQERYSRLPRTVPVADTSFRRKRGIIDDAEDVLSAFVKGAERSEGWKLKLEFIGIRRWGWRVVDAGEGKVGRQGEIVLGGRRLCRSFGRLEEVAASGGNWV
ncbi:hypothetical protein RUND412_003828 [Rhizina undulata]